MIWRVFRSPPILESDSLAIVVDNLGTYPIDKDYRELGEREGWLIKTGYYRDEYERLVWTFAHRPL